MTAPLGWLQLKHKPLRLLVALAGIAFAVLLIMMQLGFRSALFESAVRFHERFDYDIALFSPDSVFIVRPQAFSIRRLAQAQGFEAVATGHYARTRGDGRLFAATDASKDQSYFLHAVSAEALAETVFPLGELIKGEVRQIAHTPAHGIEKNQRFSHFLHLQPVPLPSCPASRISAPCR